MGQEVVNRKIVIMGEAAVGKTSLATRYLGASFKGNYIPTIGANFTSKVFERDDIKFRVMIIDLAGQESFQIIREKYFVGASGVMLVFDVTRPFNAEEQIKPWVGEILRYTNDVGLPTAVLGNKTDLTLLRQIDTYSGINAASMTKGMMETDIPVNYFETSAKEGSGVVEAFEWLIKQVISKGT